MSEFATDTGKAYLDGMYRAASKALDVVSEVLDEINSKSLDLSVSYSRFMTLKMRSSGGRQSEKQEGILEHSIRW